jgi:hypothetical protein
VRRNAKSNAAAATGAAGKSNKAESASGMGRKSDAAVKTGAASMSSISRAIVKCK